MNYLGCVAIVFKELGARCLWVQEAMVELVGASVPADIYGGTSLAADGALGEMAVAGVPAGVLCAAVKLAASASNML
jgi:hypothetical protein